MNLRDMIQNHNRQITGPCKEHGRTDVFCDSSSKCSTCGWNYDVEAKRKEKIRELLQKTQQVKEAKA